MTNDFNEIPSHTLLVTAESAGQRLDVFVAEQLRVSRARAQKLLVDATVNGARAKSSLPLKQDDEVRLNSENGATERSSTSAPIQIDTESLPPVLFEDEHLLIINKPCGLVVHAGAGEHESTLVDILQAVGKPLSNVGPPERAGIVHRLDKDTSGVLAVCKTDAAHWKLAEAFASRNVTKEYSALVCGVPSAPGRVEAPIARHPVHRKKMSVIANGRPAVTEYSVEKSWRKFSLLKVNILTGRTHQIRVHLQYVGFPVVGDALYGGSKRAMENAPNAAVLSAMEKLHGQALHAMHLAFVHPVTGEPISCYAPLPASIDDIVKELDAASAEGVA